MKINSQNPLPRPAQTNQRDESQPVKGSAPAGRSDAGPSATTSLSHQATDTSRDIDNVRVEEIREAIRDGRLEVRAERIADALIESLAAESREP